MFNLTVIVCCFTVVIDPYFDMWVQGVQQNKILV